MNIVKYLIHLLLLFSLLCCKKDGGNKIKMVFFLDKDEIAIVKYNEEVKVINNDSCRYSEFEQEFLYDSDQELPHSDEAFNQFSLSIRGKCNFVLDTVITSKERITLIGLKTSNTLNSERVYYHTENTMKQFYEWQEQEKQKQKDSLNAVSNNDK